MHSCRHEEVNSGFDTLTPGWLFGHCSVGREENEVVLEIIMAQLSRQFICGHLN